MIELEGNFPEELFKDASGSNLHCFIKCRFFSLTSNLHFERGSREQ